jgi:hypothetical protein
VEVEALLTKDKLPDTVPLTSGEKVTVKGTLCPDAIVSGRLIPPIVNWELVDEAEDRVTLAPLAVSTPLWFELEPTETVPNDTDAGVAVNCPALAPVPDRATERLESAALEAKINVPFDVPAEAVKPTVRVRLCPAARVCGLKAPMVNPFPLTAACVIPTLDPPVLLTVTDCVWLVPTGRLPKFRLAGDGVR